MSEPFPPPEDDSAKKKKPQSVGHGLGALGAHPLAEKSAESNEEDPQATPISLDTLQEETPVHDSKSWTGDSAPEQYAQEYETLKETVARLVQLTGRFPEAGGKAVEKGTEKFKAYSGYFSAKRAELGTKIKERLRKLGVDIKEDVKTAAKSVAHVATHPGEVIGTMKSAAEKTVAYAKFIASEEAALYGRGRLLFEDGYKTMLAAGEWYRKQPMRRKMYLAGALAATGLATGGTAAFYAVSGVSAVSRFFSGSAGYVTAEALIEKGITAYEEKHGKAPEERSKILSGGKHAIALLAGLAIGSGALGRGLAHLGKAGFEEIGGDDAVKWLEGIWAGEVAEIGSIQKMAEPALHSAEQVVGETAHSAAHAARDAFLSAEQAIQEVKDTFVAPAPLADDHFAGHIAPPDLAHAPVTSVVNAPTEVPRPDLRIPSESEAASPSAPSEVGSVEEVVVTAHAPIHFAPVDAVAGRGYEQMLLGLKAQALAHKAEILAAHGGDIHKVPEATRLLLTEKVHVIASEGGFGRDVALGSKLSVSADGSHFTIDAGHGPTEMPHTAPVPEPRPEPASAPASETTPPAQSQEKIVDDLTRWHAEHPDYGDAPVQVNADGSIAPIEGAGHAALAPETAAATPEPLAPEIPTTVQPPTGEEIADKLTAWHAAHPGMENAQLQLNADGTVTPLPHAGNLAPAPSAPQVGGAEGAGATPHGGVAGIEAHPQVSPAVAALEEGPPFLSGNGSFTIDPAKPELYGYTYGDHTVLFVSGGGVGDDGLKARLDYIQQFVAQDPKFHDAHIYMDASELKPNGASVEDVGELYIDQNGVVAIEQPTVYDTLLQHKMPLPDPHTDFSEKFNLTPRAS